MVQFIGKIFAEFSLLLGDILCMPHLVNEQKKNVMEISEYCQLTFQQSGFSACMCCSFAKEKKKSIKIEIQQKLLKLTRSSSNSEVIKKK